MNETLATEGFLPAEAQQIRATLTELDATLGRLTGSADQDFLRIGNALGHAVEVFGRLGGNLAALAEQLHSDDAKNTVAALEQAIQGISRMSGGDGRTAPILIQLDDGATEVDKRLGMLRRIVGEVVALAINGKIQAALVTTAGVDFSVFTTEIGRLGHLAEASTEQAAQRLGNVHTAVASARQAAADFERNEARELEAVRARIQSSLSLLSERRHRAAAAADSVAVRSRQISQRIASTVGELQINDSVSQRMEHIRTALRTVTALAAAEPVTEPGCQWLDQLPPERRRPMVGGITLLQAAQLKGGGDDYRTEVEGLIRNLSALASDAANIQAEAEGAFGGGGGGLFIAEIEQDVRRATELLTAHADARQRAGSVVGAVSEGFRAMAADLAAIQSVDADMRVMGLNATLKCGRLGDEGRALGVVAHELRACSKRTEDCSHGIADLLRQVLALSDALASASTEEDGQQEVNPIEIMAGSIGALSHLGGSMSDALTELRNDAGGVSEALTETAGSIDIHKRMDAAAEDGAARLVKLAAGLVAEADIDDETHTDIHRLMQPHYTMDRERIIHQTFAKDDSAATAMQSATGADDDLDGMFL